MSVQHTPGPWKAYPIEMNHGLPYTPVAANTLLAKVYSEAFGDYEQSEANARLVAAAPDLLEALKLADAMLSGANMNANVVEQKVRAAIAKAKDGTS